MRSIACMWAFFATGRATVNFQTIEDYKHALKDKGLPEERDESLRDDMRSVAHIFREHDANNDEYLSKKVREAQGHALPRKCRCDGHRMREWQELLSWVKDSGGTGSGGSLQSQAEQMMLGVDTNRDGRASMEEFINFALSLKRTEGPPKPWSIEEEQEDEIEKNRKRQVIAPDGMSEEDARAILEAQDADRRRTQAAEAGVTPKTKKGKKKKRRKAA